MSNHAEQLQNDIRLIQEVQKHNNLYDHRCKDKDSKARELSWSEIGKKLWVPPDACKNRWKNLRDKYTREKKLLMTEGEECYRYHQWPLLDEMSFLWNFVSHRKLVTKVASDTSSVTIQAIPGKVNKSISKESSPNRPEWADVPVQYGFRDDSNSVEPNVLDPACVLVEEEGRVETYDDEDVEDLPPRSKLRRLLQTKDEENSEHSQQENLTDSNYHSDSIQSIKTAQIPRLSEEEYFCMSLAGSLRRLPKQKSSRIKIKIMELLHEAQFGDNT